MKSHRKYFRSLGAASLLLGMAQSASALQIKIDRIQDHYIGLGGEFHVYGATSADVNQLASIRNGYSDLAKIGVATGFETFCLEYGESVSVAPGTYDAAFSRGAMSGGGALGSSDAVSLGTAQLFTEFATGALASFVVNGSTFGYHYNTAARATDAGKLQEAIWFLENEIGLSNAQIGANIFLAYLGITSLGDSDLTAKRLDNNLSTDAMWNDVWVINMGPAGQYYPNQDQLVYIKNGGGYSVPDGGSTAMLLGGVLSGLAFLKRKMA